MHIYLPIPFPTPSSPIPCISFQHRSSLLRISLLIFLCTFVLPILLFALFFYHVPRTVFIAPYSFFLPSTSYSARSLFSSFYWIYFLYPMKLFLFTQSHDLSTNLISILLSLPFSLSSSLQSCTYLIFILSLVIKEWFSLWECKREPKARKRQVCFGSV